MIERKIVAEKIKEHQIEEYIAHNLRNSGHSHTKVQRTPLGEKVIIYAARPGLIVGRKGQNIKKLTNELKNKFNLENPQLEISEVENVNLDAHIVAERIAVSLEKYGSMRFKGIAHKVMQDVMYAGALGVEIVISGKVPGTRAKSWRFYQGYMKKCGDISLTGVDKAQSTAKLKSGIIGVKVNIMPPTTKLPDNVKVSDEPIKIVEEKPAEEETKKKPKRAPRKKAEEKPAESAGGVAAEKTVEGPKAEELKEEKPSKKKTVRAEGDKEKKE